MATWRFGGCFAGLLKESEPTTPQQNKVSEQSFKNALSDSWQTIFHHKCLYVSNSKHAISQVSHIVLLLHDIMQKSF